MLGWNQNHVPCLRHFVALSSVFIKCNFDNNLLRRVKCATEIYRGAMIVVDPPAHRAKRFA